MEKTLAVVLIALCGAGYLTQAWPQGPSLHDLMLWPEKPVTLAEGKRQSPIRISDIDGIAYKVLPKLVFEGFDKVQGMTATNTGHSLKAFLNYGEPLPTITGGPLKAYYSFAQVHFHWGRSEHVINHHTYDVEGHAVFFKSEYGSFENALEYTDGLAVIGFFLEESPSSGTLTELFNVVPSLQETGSQASITGSAVFKWLSLTQPTMDYYTYPGSLTSAPYAENLVFMLFPQAGRITTEELNALKAMQDHDGEPILENSRELQPRNQRPVVYAMLNGLSSV